MIELSKNNGREPATRLMVNPDQVAYLEIDLLDKNKAWVYFLAGPKGFHRLDVNETLDEVREKIEAYYAKNK